MKQFLHSILLVIGFCSNVNSQKILWERSFGGKYDDYLTDAIPTADYGFILGGSSLSPNRDNAVLGKGNYDYCIWKVSEDGDLEWQKSFGGSGNDMLFSVINTNDGGYLLAGTSNSPIGGQKTDACIGQDDIWIIKLDARGNELWQKTLGGFAQEELKVIIQTKNNGFLIGASSASDNFKFKKTASNKNTIYKDQSNRGNMDYWLVALDSKGELEWQKTLGGNYLDQLRSVVQTSDGGYFVGGISNSDSGTDKLKDCNGQTDFWYMKLDTKGTLLWQDTYGGSGDENLYSVLETKDHDLLMAGNTNSSTTPAGNAPQGSDFMVLKLDKDGKLLWEKLYNVGKQDIMTSVIQNSDQSIVLCGYSRNDGDTTGTMRKNKTPEGLEDYIIIKTDKNGEELWENYYGSTNSDVLSKAIETRDGGYLLAGTSDTRPKPIVGSTAKKGATNLLNGKNEQFEDTKEKVNQQLIESTKQVTDEVNSYSNAIKNTVKDKMGLKEDSPLQLNAPALDMKAPGLGDGEGSGLLGTTQKQAGKFGTSRDKKTSLGGTDFWIVKVRDEKKQVTAKASIEAFPNPTVAFTNVIVGYDYTKGTATVVDLSGRILQQFEINGRTVPVDLSGYPEGIYIVNIKTEVQSDGVKIIKGIKN